MREDERLRALRDVSGKYLATIARVVRQEYPNDLRHPMTGPDDRPTPREIHPAFYGCFDWHSSVEMHWALVRLLRVTPDAALSSDVRAVLDEHLTAEALATEAAYFVDHPGFKRPYGWGWTLTLAHELSTWDDPGARRWSANIRPLADAIAALFVGWLPRATYPSREGTHGNSAFGWWSTGWPATPSFSSADGPVPDGSVPRRAGRDPRKSWEVAPVRPMEQAKHPVTALAGRYGHPLHLVLALLAALGVGGS
jgi:hypothetical protein